MRVEAEEGENVATLGVVALGAKRLTPPEIRVRLVVVSGGS